MASRSCRLDGPRQAWRPHHARGARHSVLSPERSSHATEQAGPSPPNAVPSPSCEDSQSSARRPPHGEQIPVRQGAEPNATFRVGADGETEDFKGLTLSNSSPVHLGSRGFSSRRCGVEKADMSRTRTRFTFRVAILPPRPPKPPPPKATGPPPPPPTA